MTPEELAEWRAQVQELDITWPVGKELVVPDHATVVVAGAYQGKVIQYMLERYPQLNFIVGFEPQPWAYDRAVKRLRTNPAHTPWEMRPYGLAAAQMNLDLPMGEWGTDACSTLLTSRDTGYGSFRRADQELRALGRVDLFIMNMEGYEWELLPFMLQHDIMPDSLCVQFHQTEDKTKEVADMYQALYDFYGAPIHDDYPSWVYYRKIQA